MDRHCSNCEYAADVDPGPGEQFRTCTHPDAIVGVFEYGDTPMWCPMKGIAAFKEPTSEEFKEFKQVIEEMYGADVVTIADNMGAIVPKKKSDKVKSSRKLPSKKR